MTWECQFHHITPSSLKAVSKHVTQVAHIQEQIYNNVMSRNMTNERWTGGHCCTCQTVEAALFFTVER